MSNAQITITDIFAIASTVSFEEIMTIVNMIGYEMAYSEIIRFADICEMSCSDAAEMLVMLIANGQFNA